jgi:hypothetical protein
VIPRPKDVGQRKLSLAMGGACWRINAAESIHPKTLQVIGLRCPRLGRGPSAVKWLSYACILNNLWLWRCQFLGCWFVKSWLVEEFLHQCKVLRPGGVFETLQPL